MAAFSSNETEVIERVVDVVAQDAVEFTRIWSEKRLNEVKQWAGELKRICLQFPDDLLKHSVTICSDLQENLPDHQFFILADTTYCPCCVDEVGAQHIAADGLVHFGPACLTKQHGTDLNVLYMFTEEELNGPAVQEHIRKSFPEKESKIAVFYSIGVAHQVDVIRSAMQEFPNSLVATLAIDTEPDLLHWKTEGVKDFAEFTCLYIGQDDQSFFNLGVSVGAAQWHLYDNRKDTLATTPLSSSAWLRKRMFYIEKCKDAQAIGIVHGTVSSKGHLDISERIQVLARAHNIRTILISVGKLNPAKLANFMEIDCFVLIGCPQNNMYTSREFYKPLISVFECELALNPAWKEQLPTSYSTDFKEMLPNGKHFSEVDQIAGQIEGHDISLITGSVRGQGSRPVVEQNGTTDLMHVAGNVVAERTAGDALRERTWRGLEQNLGQDEVADVQQGRSGIPIRYEENEK